MRVVGAAQAALSFVKKARNLAQSDGRGAGVIRIVGSVLASLERNSRRRPGTSRLGAPSTTSSGIGWSS